MIYIIIFISLILDGIISNISSILIPLFTLLSLIIIKPYYKINKNYLILSFILGILYDIAYTDLLYINAILFLLTGYFIIFITKRLRDNIFNVTIISILTIIYYRTLSYLTYIISTKDIFNINILFKSIYSSIIINILYIIICYIITSKTSKKTYRKYNI
ncbi:MAG: rod shape-determining protein MreD [Bacilli bacterium]|nr:rod shape-determining protein MreD [Bacilli bacterium]